MDCETIEAKLLEVDADALEGEHAAHVAECDRCRTLIAMMRQVDGELASLPAIEPPAELVERAIERARSAPAPETVGVWALLVALVSGIASGLLALPRALVRSMTLRPPSARGLRWALAITTPIAAALALVFGTVAYQGGGDSMLPAAGPGGLRGEAQAEHEAPPTDLTRDRTLAIDEATGEPMDALQTATVDAPVLAPTPQAQGQATAETIALELPSGSPATLEDGEGLPLRVPAGDAIEQRDDWHAPATDLVIDGRFGNTTPELRNTRETELDRGGRDQGAEPFRAGLNRDEEQGRRLDRQSVLAENAPAGGEHAGPEPSRWSDVAVPFHPSDGHWANTYVPGDPAVRLLRRQLMAHGPIAGERALALAEHAERLVPAIDPPASGALAVSASADRSAIDARSRVRMHVSLRGAAVRSGRRPALHAVLLLDLRRPLDEDGQARVRSLLTAASRARMTGDRIGVVVAGPHGGTLITPGELRLGEVGVGLRRLFDPTNDASAMDLATAYRQAAIAAGSLESEVLGSALVLLVSPSLDSSDASLLSPAVHAASLAGVSTSAIGLTEGTLLEPLESIALAGQGRRRVLESLAGAEGLVREEIAASSRVVARAVRLQVRLAPGVHLVDVLGSRPLDEVETRRVREQERAVDAELARQLGIDSDRREDEDGIQIVIPAFYANDTHVVLLDLVADQPGPLADVQVRFKDLVRLGNGRADTSLALERGPDVQRPAQRAVTQSRLAFEVAAALRDAAALSRQGNAAAARARIESARLALAAARTSQPELGRALTNDLELCAHVDRARASGGDPSALSDALRYASRRRLHGDPLGL